MAKFVRKPLPVDAYRLADEQVVQTSRGPRRATFGDWVVRIDGSCLVMGDSVFRSIYDAVDDEGRKMLEQR